VLWGVFSAVLMVLGFVKRSVTYRRTAIILFAITILKIFLYDMRNVSTPFRIISFIVIGLLLIGASFLYYKYKNVLLPPEEKPETPV
jgi:uncharacterized membrane protein